MPDLSFEVTDVEFVTFAAAPLLSFTLKVANRPAEERIHTVVLHTQIRLEVTRRRYGEAEHERLRDLFGEPSRWGETLRSMLWTHADRAIPGFSGEVTVDLPVPCSYDFNLAATKYLHGLEEGEIPLTFLFSGTAFYERDGGALQVAPISWDKEATFPLPVETWRRMMAHYYPETVWLHLRADLFDRLHRHKMDQGLATWEETLESLLRPVQGGVPR